ncbi:uncharacterized protein O3C94_015081 [Discoglossus pictus]
MEFKGIALLLLATFVCLVATNPEHIENKAASDMSVDLRSDISEALPPLRVERSVLGLCRFCCGCCRRMKGCGMCCRT